ncbi:MAG: DUF3095 domain-containing protein [Alphaproteobacteria bacterium]
MSDGYAAIKSFDDFDRVVDPAVYRPLPDDWQVGVSDVVDSRAAIREGRYRAVNTAGAAIISALMNALDGEPFPFVFGGDGARFLVASEHGHVARDAMARTARWVRTYLSLDLRVGMTSIATVRAAGHDVRVARYEASPDACYAMFSGGGIEWVEQQLKSGEFRLDPAPPDALPDLTGLSCQWGPVGSKNGVILSLIVKPGAGAALAVFAELVRDLLAELKQTSRLNPLPSDGPNFTWPSGSLALHAGIHRTPGNSALMARLRATATAAMAWTLLKTGWRLGRFDPAHYRRVMVNNTDYRKYDDGLMMTVDCTEATAAALERRLGDAAAAGIVHFGLHRQETAVMTCIVPSVLHDGHLHFLDGGGGGYAQAAEQLEARKAQRHAL